MLKDLGLRCSEVARLSLNDIDWIQGIVTIKKTKSHSERILPLHAITGQAIERYLLYSRPVTPERILFVRFKNELSYQMGTSQVRETVRGAAVRAGLEHFKGTHMLRHTAAKEMINNGIDLKTIADVLIPLWQKTTKCLVKYMQENRIQGNDYLLSGRNVEHLTRSGVRYRIDNIVKKASEDCSSLRAKLVTPHVFRHSTAMSLLQSGVDISTIAIWLGHESIDTTHKYMVADIKLKENEL